MAEIISLTRERWRRSLAAGRIVPLRHGPPVTVVDANGHKLHGWLTGYRGINDDRLYSVEIADGRVVICRDDGAGPGDDGGRAA